MEIPWVQILVAAFTSSAFTTGLLAILLFAGKSLIERWLSRNLEKYKAELQLAAFERQTRFTKLHEEQIKVIAELYRQLVQIQYSLSSLAATIQSDRHNAFDKSIQEEEDKTQESIGAFWEYFEQHRIYFAKSLWRKIEEFHKQSMSIMIDLFSADLSKKLVSEAPLHDDVPFERYAQEMTNALNNLANKVPPIRRDIEKEFHRILGVDQTNDGIQ